MRIVELTEETRSNLLENLLKRSPNSYGEYEQTVNEIIAKVRNGKDDALFALTEQFDHCRLTADHIRVTKEEIRQAYETVSPEFVEVLKKAAENIMAFHQNKCTTAGFCPGRTVPF